MLRSLKISFSHAHLKSDSLVVEQLFLFAVPNYALAMPTFSRTVL